MCIQLVICHTTWKYERLLSNKVYNKLLLCNPNKELGMEWFNIKNPLSLFRYEMIYEFDIKPSDIKKEQYTNKIIMMNNFIHKFCVDKYKMEFALLSDDEKYENMEEEAKMDIVLQSLVI